jgi:hypothetical protein
VKLVVVDKSLRRRLARGRQLEDVVLVWPHEMKDLEEGEENVEDEEDKEEDEDEEEKAQEKARVRGYGSALLAIADMLEQKYGHLEGEEVDLSEVDSDETDTETETEESDTDDTVVVDLEKID